MPEAVYLDYNATAPVRPEVRQRMLEVLAAPMNPSSVHGYGRAAKKILEDARKTVAESISAFPNEIIFMATGTEANTTALTGIRGRRVLVSKIEHSSVIKRGEAVIDVDSNGIVDLAKLDALLAATPDALVSVILANNETGVVQPINDIAATCKKHGALLHTDAVQALGKIPLEFAALGADMMSIAAHKMGGPVGAAALVVRQDLPITPLFTGGGQELSRRAGTENVAAIAGFAAAVELIDLAQAKQLRPWLQAVEAVPGVISFGTPAPRLPNTSCIAIPGLSQEVALMKLDLQGISVSAGSACSSGRIEPSHVLTAMGVDKVTAGSAIRISAGWNTTKDDIDHCVTALQKIRN